MRRTLGDCAVVLGGSVAGLLAARVLTERFATVVVVERDRLPNGAEPRRGVPQGKHIHGLLAGGQQAIEQLLPGLTTGLAADGVPVGDPLADLRVCLNGHHFRRGPSGLTLVSASRNVLEHHLRRRIRSLPAVSFIDRCDVVGLAEDGGRITGVRMLRRIDDSVEELLDVDLVVDATGRGSRAPVWLSDIGFPRPEEERRRVDLGYTTRRYHLPPGALDGGLGLGRASGPDPWPSSRSGSGPAGARRVDADVDRSGRRPSADPRRGLRPVRRIGRIGGHPSADPGRRAHRCPRRLPLPGQHAPPLRTDTAAETILSCWATACAASTPSTAKA